MTLIQRIILFVAISVSAFALALLLDRPVAQAAADGGLPRQLRRVRDIGGWKTTLGDLLKSPGHWEVAIAAAAGAVVVCRRKPRWHAGLLVVLSGLLSGGNGLLKWLVGRARPFREPGTLEPIADLRPFHLEPMTGGWSGIINTPNLCFPSGHAALAFAVATALAILFPRWRWAFYAIAAITAAERFLENAHWLSDTVAAAALGIGGARVIHWLLRERLFAAPAEPQAIEAVTKAS